MPVVAAPLAELERVDVAAFRPLAGLPWGMTAHVLYTAIDASRAGTCSAAVIDRAIRGAIGFDGLLLTDDLSMQALGGGLGERAAAALEAGCDVALHCNGAMAEMESVAGVFGPLTAAALRRLESTAQKLELMLDRTLSRAADGLSANDLAAAAQLIES